MTHRFVYAEMAHSPSWMVTMDPVTAEETVYRIIADHLGSIRLVIEVETGEIAQRIDYGPFGEVLFDSNPGLQPFGFAGGLYDRDTGLVRFGARDYDPKIGRWTAKDPIGFGGGDSNLFVYAYNQPINLVDPMGLTPVGEARISVGLQVGYGVRYGPLKVGADINLLSHVQRSGHYEAYMTQSFGGSFTLFGYGPSVETSRAVPYPAGCISSVPFEGPLFKVPADVPLPGLSGTGLRRDGDFIVATSVKLFFGIDLEWNVSETGRRLGGLVYDFFGSIRISQQDS